jgi:hypothetical protein
MKFKPNQIIIIFVLIALVLLDIFCLYGVFAPQKNLPQKKEEDLLFQDLKGLKQAIDFLTQRKPLNPPEATGEATVSAKLKIKILNGSGINGKANQVKAALERLGENWEIITTNGEATSSSVLKSKKDVDHNSIKKIISAFDKNATTEGLDETAPFDVLIILGGR